jgi:hypothetical protein
VQRQVQFKLGLCRQDDCQVGDTLTFDASSLEFPQEAHVLVDGAPEECPVCGYEPDDEEVFAIEIDNGVIVAAKLAEPALATKLLATGALAIGSSDD